MGDYYGLRVRGTLKEQFRQPIYKAAFEPPTHNLPISFWGLIAKETSSPEILKWMKVRRSNFIPRGILCYMPWKDDDLDWEHTVDTSSGQWQFQCSLKSKSTIDYFWENICPLIFQEITHFEVYDEVLATSTHYHLQK